MTLPYVPGIGDILASYSKTLGPSIAQAIDPNIQQQLELRKSIAQDPELLTKLATIEKNSPGVLANMGFGHVADAISKMNLDPNVAAKQDVARDVSKVATNPETATDVGRVQSGLPTEAEGNVQKSNARIAAANAGIDEDKLNKINAQNDNLKAALAKYPDLANVDIAGVAKNLFEGKPLDKDPIKANALAVRVQSDPTLANTLKQYYDAMSDRAKLAVENNRLDVLRNSSRGEQAVAAKQVLDALKEANKKVATYQNVIKQGKPTDAALADTPGPMGDAARQHMQLYQQAHDELPKAMEEAKNYQGMYNYMLKQLPGAGDFLKHEEASTAIQSASPLAQQLYQALTNGTGTIQQLQSSANWKKLKPNEQQMILQAAQQ